MKEKILGALKTKYKSLGLQDSAFNGVADTLAKTITEESQIENAVAEVEGYMKLIQGESDRVRGEKATLQKELDELKRQSGQTQQPQTSRTEPTQGGDEMPEWFKAYAETKEKEIEALKAAFTQDQTAARKKERDALFNKSIEGLADTYAKPIKDAYALLGDNVDDVKFQEFIASTQSSTKEINAQQNTYVPNRGAFAKGTLSDSEVDKIVAGIN